MEERTPAEEKIVEEVGLLVREAMSGDLAAAARAVGSRLDECLRIAVEREAQRVATEERAALPATAPCACGASRLRLSGQFRRRTLELSCGVMSYERPYYAPTGASCRCPGRFPSDERLGLPAGRLELDLVQKLCLLAVLVPFERGVDLSRRLLGFKLSKKRMFQQVKKVADEVYRAETELAQHRWEERRALIQARPPETQRQGNLFVVVDGSTVGIQNSEEFRECKSAVLFWERDVKVSTGKRGKPRRQILRRRIVSHVGSHSEFLPYLWNAIVDVGGLSAQKIIWIADGSEWLWNDSLEILPEADFDVIELLDWYHLFQNLWKAARAFSSTDAAAARWIAIQKRKMRRRNTGRGLVKALDDKLPNITDEETRKVVRNARDYVDRHQHRLRYADFKQRGWPRGSAAIESVQHGVLQARFKLPGMRWTLVGVNPMLRLRNAYFSAIWEEVVHAAFATWTRRSPTLPEEEAA